MKNSASVFRKIISALCFFVLQSLSAMVDNRNVDEQNKADLRFYNVLVSLSRAPEGPLIRGCSSSSVNELGIERCWGLFPKVVVISRDVNTGHLNLIYDNEVKDSGMNIDKSFDEILGTNYYTGFRLVINSDLSRAQILSEIESLCNGSNFFQRNPTSLAQ